ncbi:MAG: hypothetical protein FE78DRAFT_216397 [Acidomyces sp. 'richmondensis']|nr:MAG: hypothetical protein FE78DRAFT_216397 [Acidomyces sp. 'richmondensis']
MMALMLLALRLEMHGGCGKQHTSGQHTGKLQPSRGEPNWFPVSRYCWGGSGMLGFMPVTLSPLCQIFLSFHGCNLAREVWPIHLLYFTEEAVPSERTGTNKVSRRLRYGTLDELSNEGLPANCEMHVKARHPPDLHRIPLIQAVSKINASDI